LSIVALRDAMMDIVRLGIIKVESKERNTNVKSSVIQASKESTHGQKDKNGNHVHMKEPTKQKQRP
jgi:hypothetical protein